jgi:3-oxoadipate enol-lactonase
MPLDNRTEIGSHEALALAGEDMLKQLSELAEFAPELSRCILQNGFGDATANTTTDLRVQALLTIGMLICMGDSGDQLEVYLNAALKQEATRDEILDVVNLASLYAGAPRAVNGARRMAGRLADIEPTPASVRIVRLDDHDTMLWDSGGSGTPILLMHALCMDHRFWKKVFPRLASSARVIAYDIRGHGRARGAPATQSLNQVGDDAARLLDILGIGTADICGASYGGAIAQHFAFNHLDRTRSLSLLATGLKAPSEMLAARATAAEMHGMEAQVGTSIMRWFLPDTIARNPWEVRYARNCVRRALVRDWAASWGGLGPPGGVV